MCAPDGNELVILQESLQEADVGSEPGPRQLEARGREPAAARIEWILPPVDQRARRQTRHLELHLDVFALDRRAVLPEPIAVPELDQPAQPVRLLAEDLGDVAHEGESVFRVRRFPAA